MRILLIICICIFIISVLAIFTILIVDKTRNKDHIEKIKMSKSKKDKEKKILETNDKDNNKEEINEVEDDDVKTENVLDDNDNEKENSLDEIENDIEIDQENEEPKEIVPQTLHSNSKKSRTVLLYDNINVPTLKILDYKDGNLVNEINFDLTGYELDKGLITNIHGLADQIQENIGSIDTLDCLLNINECFRNVVSLPKISKSKSLKLYKKELNEDFKDYKDTYLTFKNVYKHNLGTVYYTYFIPLIVIDYFKKLATLLNAKLGNIDIWGEYLFNTLNKSIKEDFSLIYLNNKVATLVTSINHSLVSYNTFKYENEDDIVSVFLSNISKHEFELEKQKLDNYIIVSDEDLSLSEIRNNLNEIKVDFNFDKYNVEGIRL